MGERRWPCKLCTFEGFRVNPRLIGRSEQRVKSVLCVTLKAELQLQRPRVNELAKDLVEQGTLLTCGWAKASTNGRDIFGPVSNQVVALGLS